MPVMCIDRTIPCKLWSADPVIQGERQHRIISDMLMEQFNRQKGGWFRVVSGSMRPMLNVGDRIFVEQASASRVFCRDIILFQKDGVFVTHRVIKVIKENGEIMLLQRGDAGGIPGIIPGHSVLGVVTIVEKRGRPLSVKNGRVGVVNIICGFANICNYAIKNAKNVLAQGLRKKAGYRILRLVYHGIRCPFVFLNRAIMIINNKGSSSK